MFKLTPFTNGIRHTKQLTAISPIAISLGNFLMLSSSGFKGSPYLYSYIFWLYGNTILTSETIATKTGAKNSAIILAKY